MMSAVSRNIIVTALRDLAMSSDAGRAPDRRGAPRRTTPVEHARCKRGDARGSVVSPGSLLQDQLIQRQVRYDASSRAFSVSRSFNRFTWSLFRPPTPVASGNVVTPENLDEFRCIRSKFT